MKQKIRILTSLILLIMILNSCSVYKTESCLGKIGNNEYQNTVIKTNRFEGVIFSKEYIGLLNSAEKKFTPSTNDIDLAEIILREGIKDINANKPNQVDNCPVIHKRLNKYKRQYFGYFNKNGDKIIIMNCFWDEKRFYKEPINNQWKTEEKIVLDGCSYYWSIKVNLNKKTLFDFGVNGIG